MSSEGKLKKHDPNRDIWHPGEKKWIKRDGILTEFGRKFFEKYDQHVKQQRINGNRSDSKERED